MSNPPFLSSYRVYYEDTDAAGVVYYANYLKYAERARTEYLRHIYQSPSQIAEKHGVVFVVRKCEIDYMLPAFLDDMLVVQTKISQVRAAMIGMEQQIIRNQQHLVHIKIILACVEVKKIQVARIPAPLRQKLTDVCPESLKPRIIETMTKEIHHGSPNPNLRHQ